MAVLVKIGYQLAVVLSCLALRYIHMHDLRRRLIMPILLLTAIVGSLVVPVSSLVLDSFECFRDGTCISVVAVLNNVADGICIGAFGLAAVLRARAMTDYPHHRRVFAFLLVYAAYMSLDFVGVLIALGVVEVKRPILDNAVLSMNLLMTLNTLCLELYVLEKLKRGLNAHRFQPFRRRRTVIQSLMFCDFVGMTTSCLMAIWKNSKYDISVTIMMVATSSHILSFCMLNNLVQKAFNNVVEFSLSATDAVSRKSSIHSRNSGRSSTSIV